MIKEFTWLKIGSMLVLLASAIAIGISVYEYNIWSIKIEQYDKLLQIKIEEVKTEIDCLKQQNVELSKEINETMAYMTLIEVMVDAMNNVSISDEDLFKQSIPIHVTAYNMGKFTATSKHVKPGMISATKNLINKWGYGSTLILFGKNKDGTIYRYGEFVLEDKMSYKLKDMCDIYMFNSKDVNQFGKQHMWVIKKE